MKRRITFTAGDKEYSLRFGTNAMARYEEMSGEPAFQALQRLDGEAPPILMVRNLFRCALEQDVSAEDAGDLMDEVGLQKSLELFGEAVRLAYPEAAANPPKPREKTTATR